VTQQAPTPSDPQGPYAGPPLYRPVPSRDGPSIASVVCGAIAILIGWIPVVGLIGLVVAVAAVVTGIIGVRRPGERVLAIVGLVCGGLVILLWIGGILLFVTGLYLHFSN
jgi:hypothetical protein